MKKPLNAYNFHEKKINHEKISMITCYDYSFASILNESFIDCLLVGDSAAMVMHGYNSTIHASMNMMVYHTRAVSAGAPNKFIIGDLPFLSYRKSLNTNMKNMELLMKAGAQALKLEGSHGNLKLIEHAVNSGIPIMGHLGLTPQSVHTLGGFKVQGKDEVSGKSILDQAKSLQDSGCFALVLECIPSELARKITNILQIPTIGIGAGPNTDGQVLVLQDMLGFNEKFKPKFLKTYYSAKSEFLNIFNFYHKEVVEQEFPTEKESYTYGNY